MGQIRHIIAQGLRMRKRNSVQQIMKQADHEMLLYTSAPHVNKTVIYLDPIWPWHFDLWACCLIDINFYLYTYSLICQVFKCVTFMQTESYGMCPLRLAFCYICMQEYLTFKWPWPHRHLSYEVILTSHVLSTFLIVVKASKIIFPRIMVVRSKVFLWAFLSYSHAGVLDLGMTLASLPSTLWSKIDLICTLYISFISPGIKYDVSKHHGREVKSFSFGGFCHRGLE